MELVKAGMQAPDFTVADHTGKDISLSDYRGRKLILYFYPKDDTPGCTAEACNLRDNYALLLSKGFAILGVSPDGGRSHKKFTEKYDLPFPLVPDEDKKIIQAYGVWGPKKFMGKAYDGVYRTTFVIDENGIVEKVIDKVDTKDHAAQILKELGI